MHLRLNTGESNINDEKYFVLNKWGERQILFSKQRIIVKDSFVHDAEWNKYLILDDKKFQILITDSDYQHAVWNETNKYDCQPGTI